MTCDMDGNATNHSYPREGIDPSYDKWLEVSGVSGNNLNVQIGTTTRANYLVSDSTYDPTTGDMTLKIGPHGYHGGSSHTITNATYDPITGDMVLTIPAHGFTIGDRVKVAPDSLSFTCGMDGNTSTKTYPRTTDPKYNQWMTISDITHDTFKVNVGTLSLIHI